MGKLGKKARKFAKKNLQSVLRKNRKLNSKFKKKKPSRDVSDVEGQENDASELSNLRETSTEHEDASLDIVSSEEDDHLVEDDESDSDEYLSEDQSCLPESGSTNESHAEDSNAAALPSAQNQTIHSELAEQRRKLESLKEKDPEFSEFLQKHAAGLQSLQNEEMDSDEEPMELENGDISSKDGGRFLTSSLITDWSLLILEKQNPSVLPSLINAYRAACHFGAESNQHYGSISSPSFQDEESFSRILMFMLREGDNIFRRILAIPSSISKIETIQKLENTSKWKNLKPMIKSYLRSTLFLLNQVTDRELLVYSVKQLRRSMIFFAAFPPLLRKLSQVAVQLWVTGRGTLSSSAFLIFRDITTSFRSDCYDMCLSKMFKAFMACCNVKEPVNLEHIQSLRDFFVEFCSLNLQKSVRLAMSSTQRLARIFQVALRTKKKEALQKLYSWEYTLCIDLWVVFVSSNIMDDNLHGLLFRMIQIIYGVVSLFPGPRYLPLRIRCIQWLNRLSSSSGVFIPVSQLVLDVLEFKTGKEAGKPGKAVDFSTVLKLPKYWLKSLNFQEECIYTVVELLSVHFAQWSYHISFPELATIPLIRLRKFHGKSTVDSHSNVVKRLIDQVEKNIDFVEKRRGEAAFAPREQQSVEHFLQDEKGSDSASFTQYYKSVMQKSASRMTDRKSSIEKKKPKRRKRPFLRKKKSGDKEDSGKRPAEPSIEGADVKTKKQRT